MNAPPIRQTSSLAIISLVAGNLGWTLAPFLGSIGAVICGHLARAEIRRSPERLEGDGLAIAGLVLGWVQITLTILFLAAVFMFFGGLAAILAWLAATAPGTIST
ncbi:MAG: DUF4190 domain-containing protein [Pseudomonadota bacterium]